MNSAADANPLMEAALSIGETVERAGDSDGNTSKPEPVNDPKTGSYESFLGTFGNPARWAGHN